MPCSRGPARRSSTAAAIRPTHAYGICRQRAFCVATGAKCCLMRARRRRMHPRISGRPYFCRTYRDEIPPVGSEFCVHISARSHRPNRTNQRSHLSHLGLSHLSHLSWPISARSHPSPGGGSGPSGSYRSMQSVQSGSALQTCGEARKEDEGQGRDEAGPGSSHIDIIRCAKCPVIVDEARMMRHVVAAPRPKKSTLVKRLVRIPFHTRVVTIRFSQLTGSHRPCTAIRQL